MGEFAPPTRKVRMTKSQVRRYIRDLEEKRKIAQEKLKKAKESGVFQKEEEELKRLEDLIDEL